MQLFTRVSPNPDSLSFPLSFFSFQPPCRALYCTTPLPSRSWHPGDRTERWRYRRGYTVMSDPRRGLQGAVKRGRLGGRDRAPADVARRAAAADRDCSDLVEHLIGARQSAEKCSALYATAGQLSYPFRNRAKCHHVYHGYTWTPCPLPDRTGGHV